MQYRKFGNTDLRISEIGFGAWAIGGGTMIGNTAIGWGNVDDDESKKAIHRSLDLGINFFDTADIYGLGHSEEMLGKTIGTIKEVMIATKVGNVSRNDQFATDYSKEYILKACGASLKRLKRNEIDYYQLHTARLQHLQHGECIEAMQLLVQQGKVRYWGLSLNTFDPLPEAECLLHENSGNGVQLVLNMLNQKALPLLKIANEKGYGIIARMPLQFGLLTGKFDLSFEASAKKDKDYFFAENDHRKKRLTKEVIDSCARALAPVWKLCDKYQCTKTQLALSYVLSYPGISATIPGIRTPQQVMDNTSGLFEIEKEDMILIEQWGATDFVPVMKLIREQG
jgi:aryl-alcohol dehydrogenase-like predicted oxidoreductase